MHCPNVSQLPPPPSGKTGWPWTEGCEQLPDAMPDGLPWPRVSIVTPSYNQAEFIEETIRSVLLQGYPSLDYLIMDGGSTDGSVGIIQRYSEWLSHWVSQPDRGQTDALNAGFRMASGQILAWLNADDTYRPGTVAEVAAIMGSHDAPVFVYGDCQQIDEAGRPLVLYRGACDGLESFLLFRAWVPQPTTFFRRSLLDEVGYLDVSYSYAMDCEFFMRIADRHTLHHIPHILAEYRVHSASKTSKSFLTSSQEYIAAVRMYWGRAGIIRRQWYFWAARKREAHAYLHCSHESLLSERRTTVFHIARAAALYPPILFGWEAMSQLLQLVIGPKRSIAAKQWLSRNRKRSDSLS